MRAVYSPSKEEFAELSHDHNLIPVYREIVADFDTPVSALAKLGESEYSFLLESVEGGERLARYSFLGYDPFLVVTCREGTVKVENRQDTSVRQVSDPLEVIEEIIKGYRVHKPPSLPSFFGGAVGYLSYDAVRYFESIPREAHRDLDLPDMAFIFTGALLIFDHLKHKIKVVVNAEVKDNAGEAYDQAVTEIEAMIERLRAPVFYNRLGDMTPDEEIEEAMEKVSSNVPRQDYLGMVKEAKEHIKAGDIFQVVLSQRFSIPITSGPFEIYRVLRTINPSPYMYYLKYGDLCLVGSSPEPLVKVEDRRVITCPIAGTRRRGSTEEEDLALAKELLADEKERAEHVMLVDLGRNDLGRVCKPSTVGVDKFMFVEKYSHVQHIVSHVSGELGPEKTSFDVLRAAFPAGTVSGAPKIRAMEIIDELEPTLRGPYAGAVGYFGFGGSLDTCITIRTVMIKDSQAYVQAGAGIVADSVPEREFKETVSKAKALLTAVFLAERGAYETSGATNR